MDARRLLETDCLRFRRLWWAPSGCASMGSFGLKHCIQSLRQLSRPCAKSASRPYAETLRFNARGLQTST
eukprot:9803094-Alexandrium_andersonii.AAC.1